MNTLKKRFLITFQYLGFGFDGVQKHPGLRTLQGMMEDRWTKLLPDHHIRLKFSSRTDKLVSSRESFCLLMIVGPELENDFFKHLGSVLTSEVKLLKCEPVIDSFILLNNIGFKEYHYYFSHGLIDVDPFSAPFISHFREQLDLIKMNEAARLFLGTHEYRHYTQTKKSSSTTRTIDVCEILRNQHFTASFFPDETYYFRVTGRGFMRGQVRLMMGALIRVGIGELSIQELSQSLLTEKENFIKFLVPASGLILHSSQLLPADD